MSAMRNVIRDQLGKLRRAPRTAVCVMCAFLLGAMAISIVARMLTVAGA